MGFSVSAASGIIGISILLIIEVSVGTIFPSIQDTSESYMEMKNRALDQLHTDITITSVNTTVNGSGHDLLITIQNTGSTTIDLARCDVLINGSTYGFQASNEYLYPQNQEDLQLTQIPGSGHQRVKVVTEQGVGTYYTYTAT
jgi:archaellum component FlaF (FlaF/FlaG flagellin family)